MGKEQRERVDAQDASAKRPKKKWPLALGVVVAVLVVAGAGFWVWHEQPSFCNAICHEPMDFYVEGYYANEGELANAHQVAAGTTCLQCHEATPETQIKEGLAWIAGDYRMSEDGSLATLTVRADTAMCATSGCHNMDEVIASTANWGGQAGVNPHESHQGVAIDCSNCHVAHGQSMMYCNTCHDYEVPTGWASPATV